MKIYDEETESIMEVGGVFLHNLVEEFADHWQLIEQWKKDNELKIGNLRTTASELYKKYQNTNNNLDRKAWYSARERAVYYQANEKEPILKMLEISILECYKYIVDKVNVESHFKLNNTNLLLEKEILLKKFYQMKTKILYRFAYFLAEKNLLSDDTNFYLLLNELDSWFNKIEQLLINLSSESINNFRTQHDRWASHFLINFFDIRITTLIKLDTRNSVCESLLMSIFNTNSKQISESEEPSLKKVKVEKMEEFPIPVIITR